MSDEKWIGCSLECCRSVVVVVFGRFCRFVVNRKYGIFERVVKWEIGDFGGGKEDLSALQVVFYRKSASAHY